MYPIVDFVDPEKDKVHNKLGTSSSITKECTTTKPINECFS